MTEQKTSKRRQWRVGTLSMGLMLIVFGTVLLLGQFTGVPVIEMVSTWWPVILIVLGVEILVSIRFSGEDKPVIKYDILSIFLVLFIGSVTFGLYLLTSVGIIPQVVEVLTSQEYTVQVPEQKMELEDGITRIVVDGSGVRLQVQDGNTDEIVAFGEALVSAKSLEDAADAVAAAGIITQRVGDTLFVDFRPVPQKNVFHHSSPASYTIVLPRGKTVNLKSSGPYALNLDIRDAISDWLVTAPNTVNVTVQKDNTPLIDVYAQEFGGTVPWELESIENGVPPEGHQGFPEQKHGTVGLDEAQGSIKISALEVNINQF